MDRITKTKERVRADVFSFSFRHVLLAFSANRYEGEEDMKEISVRLLFHFSVCIILVLVWSYFFSEWWSPVVGVLALLFGVVPVVALFFSIREEYRTEVAKTEEDARKLIEQGFEYVCTHGETMIFRRPKYEG